MGCVKSLCRTIFVGLLSLIKVAICIAIICIVAVQLYTTTVSGPMNKLKFEVECLMQGSVKGGNVCSYTFAVCGLSMLLSMVTSLLLCITCDLCGLGDWFQFIIQAFQTAWWIIAAIVITDRVDKTNDFRFTDGSKLPKEGWRDAVAILSWINAAIAATLAVVYLVQACKCLGKACGCCGGKDDDDKKGKDRSAPSEGGANPYGAPQPVGTNDEAVRANAV